MSGEKKLVVPYATVLKKLLLIILANVQWLKFIPNVVKETVFKTLL